MIGILHARTEFLQVALAAEPNNGPAPPLDFMVWAWPSPAPPPVDLKGLRIELRVIHFCFTQNTLTQIELFKML